MITTTPTPVVTWGDEGNEDPSAASRRCGTGDYRAVVRNAGGAGGPAQPPGPAPRRGHLRRCGKPGAAIKTVPRYLSCRRAPRGCHRNTSARTRRWRRTEFLESLLTDEVMDAALASWLPTRLGRMDALDAPAADLEGRRGGWPGIRRRPWIWRCTADGR
jgi:hypothetical protein